MIGTMNVWPLVAPDFALIAIGFAASRTARWRSEFWEPIEKLTYFVLFPALLFYSNAKARIDLAAAAPLLAVVVIAIFAGVALAFLGRLLLKPRADVFVAGFQCAFRFNAYIALSLTGRLAGEEGVALMSLAVGIAVPITNVAAVWMLARSKRANVLRELAVNPLIIACLAGVGYGVAGWPLPELVATVCSRFGAASLVLGLLSVGAALSLNAPLQYGLILPYLIGVKLLATPVVAWIAVQAFGLGGAAAAVSILFAASPCPSSAYVLTNRMGGNGQAVALLVSLSVIASVFTLPLFLSLLP